MLSILKALTRRNRMANIEKVFISDLEKEPLLHSIYNLRSYGLNIIPFSLQRIDDVLSKNTPHLYLLDYKTAIERSEILTIISNHNRENVVAVYNAPKQTHISALAHLCHLKGYFYPDISKQHFLHGIDILLSGGYCMPQDILEQLLHYYQSMTLRFSPPFKLNLTSREREVLSHLKEGISNTQLADDLFVSEHTVKTHLYRIYRKLDIHSRDAAIEWAHKYLP
mgnify:FL=1